MKEKIHAVFNRDLYELLDSLGLIEKLDKGLLFCSFCGKKIISGNIGCIYPLKNEIRRSTGSNKRGIKNSSTHGLL